MPETKGETNYVLAGNVGNPPVFEDGEWILYKEMLDEYFKLCKTTDDKKKVSTLINSIGMRNYKMLRDMCHPNLPAEKNYEELCALLKEYYTPKTSSFRERKSFYNLQKSTTESINDWLVRIRSAAVNCEFGASLPTVLCDRFITGLPDGKILDRICEEDVDITLKRAVDLAVKYEIKLKMDSHPGNSQLNKIQQSYTRDRTPNVTNSEGPSTSNYKPSKYSAGGSEYSKKKVIHCFRCKKAGHYANRCPENQRRSNYIENVDAQSSKNQRRSNYIENVDAQSSEDESYAVYTITTLQGSMKIEKNCSMYMPVLYINSIVIF
jgi:hypothetical protein